LALSNDDGVRTDPRGKDAKTRAVRWGKTPSCGHSVWPEVRERAVASEVAQDEIDEAVQADVELDPLGYPSFKI